MHFLSRSNSFGEKFDQHIAFGLWNTDDLRDEARVEEQALPFGHGMCPYKRVFCNDGCSSNRSLECVSSVGLHFGRVQSREALEELLHGRGKDIVSRVL